MNRIIIILTSIILTSSANSQNLFLDAHVDKDSIIFRWVPTNLSSFKQGVKKGYVLEKIPWKGQDFILIDTIKAANATKTESILDQFPEDNTATIAAYYLHGEKEPEQKGFANFFEGYKQHSDEQLNLNFVLIAADMSPNASEILGLSYAFTNNQGLDKAIYRVRSIGEGKLDTASFYYTGAYSFYAEIENITLKQLGNVVKISWDNLEYQNYYTAYDVYRANSRDGSYTLLNEVPIFQGDSDAQEVIHKDSVDIGKTYFYKVQGYTAFGRKGQLSKAFEAKVLSQTVSYKAENIKAKGNHLAIEIEWQPSLENSTTIKGIHLLKANQLEGPYEEIGKGKISTNTNRYTDTNVGDDRVHYYRIAAENMNGYWYYSNPIRAVYVDEVPPASPKDLIGVIDTNGICYLHWYANEEVDLKGYRVYKSNRIDGTFYHTHDLLNYTNTYIDTVGIQFLTEELYYKVVAVDYDNNHSDYSALLTLKRPDLVPPVPAQIHNYEVIDQGLKIHIHNSPSIDVIQSFLIKQMLDSTTTQDIEIDNTQRFVIDQKFEKGTPVTYWLKTVDDAGNSAKSRSVTVNSKGTKTVISNLEAAYKDGNIELSWTYSQETNGLIIFYLQETETKEFTFLSRLPSTENDISLPWIAKGSFSIAAVFQIDEGKQEAPIFSNSITIE